MSESSRGNSSYSLKEAYSIKYTIKESDTPEIIEVVDKPVIWKHINILADTSNTNVIYVGSSNPTYPLTAGQSTILKHKKLRSLYVKGNAGDNVIILC